MSTVWGMCPRCKPDRPEPVGIRRKATLTCITCGNEYASTRPAPEGPKPNYLAMRHALRPLTSRLSDLLNRLDPDTDLYVQVAEAVAVGDDEPRMRWLLQEARYTLGLDERPTTGLRGRMQ